MPTLNIGGRKVTVDDSFMSLSPDQQNATVDEIASSFPKTSTPAAGQSSAVGDFLKSIPRGIMGGLSQAGSALGQATMHEMGQPENAAEIPNAEQTVQHLEQNITGDLHKPEGRAGKFGAAIGESVGNPASYIGPGSGVLKVAGAILSGAGGEAGGQAAEGTKFETPARLMGGLAGGTVAAKAFGPTVERAAVPTGRELKDIAGKGYNSAVQETGLTLDPKGPASWAANLKQDLGGARFSGTNGSAPKTMAALDELQSPPFRIEGLDRVTPTVVTASNLDELRKTLGTIAQEVQLSTGGALKATPDAAAATRALESLRNYTENIPKSHILAGDATDYARKIKEANANYAAGSRAQDFDARLTKAENATDRQIAGSLDSQIKSKAGQMLDNPQRMRGMNDAEKAQLQLINSGTVTSNTLRQLGRGGAGVIPMAAHVATAMATGGGSIPASLGIGVPLYAARKVAEAITKSRAADLVDMLAKRSPEYERRAAAITPTDTSPNKAAIVRAILGQIGR